MTERRPEDDDIIDAEIVEEEPEAPPEPVPATLVPEPEPEPQPPSEPFILTPIEPPPVKPATPEPPWGDPASRPEGDSGSRGKALRRSEGPATPVPGPFVGRRAARPKEEGGGLGVVALLLLGVLVAAVIWSRELTDLYNRAVGSVFGGKAPSTAPAPGRETPKGPAPASPAPARPVRPETAPPSSEAPKFEPREAPGPAPKEPDPTPAVVPVPVPEPAPGLAYSVIKRENIGVEGLQQFEFKVVVPATCKRDDLLRMAEAIVASERKQGERHAVRFLCFTDPGKTKPEDLFAEVDWGPGGDFHKAADAVNKGPDKNRFNVTLKGAP